MEGHLEHHITLSHTEFFTLYLEVEPSQTYMQNSDDVSQNRGSSFIYIRGVLAHVTGEERGTFLTSRAGGIKPVCSELLGNTELPPPCSLPFAGGPKRCGTRRTHRWALWTKNWKLILALYGHPYFHPKPQVLTSRSFLWGSESEKQLAGGETCVQTALLFWMFPTHILCL